MDLVQWGLPIVEWAQARDWLHGPARLFTALGDVEFMILWIPVVAWSVDRRVGRRLLLAMLAWGALNTIVKSVFGLPRPYWVADSVTPLAAEGSFGFPSGHAAYAAATLGTLALAVRRPWVRWLAMTMIGAIGVSRIVLGVHWPADVMGGWAMGLVVAVAVTWLDRDPHGLEGRFSQVRAIRLVAVGQLAVLPLALAVLLARRAAVDPRWLELGGRSGEVPDPSSVLGAAVLCGGLAGMLTGLLSSRERRRRNVGGHTRAGNPSARDHSVHPAGFHPSLPTGTLVLRSMVGLAVVVVVSGVLGPLVEDAGDTAAPIAWLLGAAVTWWVVDGAPRVFARVGWD